MKTLPEGLAGVLMMMARVRGVMAARSASSRGVQSGAVSGTATGLMRSEMQRADVVAVVRLEEQDLVAGIEERQAAA